VPERYRQNSRFMQHLLAQAEQAKRTLSDTTSATMSIHGDDADYTLTLDEAALEGACAKLLARLRDPVERAMRDANIRSQELDNVVLAGGATRMPLVRRMVARMFGRFPACDINPDEVVALGAAVQAGLKMKDKALDEVVMTDVAPYSLGVETSMNLDAHTYSHGHFDPIIERNTVVPVSRVKHYYPLHDGQRIMELAIYQGEARMAADNIKLGQVRIDMPAGVRSDGEVGVRFTYDANGLLEVEATVASTGHKVAVVIEGNPGLLTEQEIAERFAALSELKIHPRERLENRALLARGERMYQQLRGIAREQAGVQITLFERALATQDTRQFDPAARQFSDYLGYLEHQPFLHRDD
jgi:molecular chaperone HscC